MTLSPVSRTESAGAGSERPRSADRLFARSIDVQILEVGRALERSKRDLAAAFTRAALQDQRAADAKRRMEQLRWFNYAADANPDVARLAAAEIAAHNATIEEAKKAAADMAAQILRLQSRLERQTTRLYDLENRRRETGEADQASTGTPRTTGDGNRNAHPSRDRAPEVQQELLDQLVQIGLRAAEHADNGSNQRPARHKNSARDSGETSRLQDPGAVLA